MGKLGLKLAFSILLTFSFVKNSSLYGQDLTISGGNSVSTMLCSNGGVFTWGNNKGGPNGSPIRGLLGTGNTTSDIVTTPAQVLMPAQALPIKQVDAGSGGHFVSMGCDGTVWGWGNNGTGQVGNSTATASVITTPTQVMAGQGTDNDSDGFLDGVRYISGGNDENYAILEDGRLVAWGQNDQGQLGDGTTTDRTTPVFVRTPDGNPLENVIMVEAGDETGYALVDPDGDGIGTVYSWGGDGNGKLGRTSTNKNYAVPVEKGGVGGPPLDNIKSLTAGDVMGFAIDEDDYVWSWGHGNWGQLTGINQNLSHPYALQVFGGETGDPFLKAKAIAAGQGFGMAVTLDNRAVAWGNNGATSLSGGNLGDGTGTGSGVPVYIKTAANTPIEDVANISDGDTWGFITKTDNSIWTWGDNSVGQLGIGSTTRQAYAVAMPSVPSCAPPDPLPVVTMPDDFSTCVPYSYTIDPGFPNLNGNYIFEWYKDGVLLPSETGETLTVTDASTTGTVYKVIIIYNGPNSPCGWDPDEGEITITAYTPDFTAPTGLTFCGDDFTVNMLGDGTYSYFTAATGGDSLGTSYQNNSTTFSASLVTDVSGGNYTVYAQESGNKAGTAVPTTPGTSSGQNTGNHEMQIQIFEDLYLDSVSFDVKEYSGSATNNWQIQIFGSKSECGNNGQVADRTNVIYSGPIVSATTSATQSTLTLPVGAFLPGSSGGEFYWIGLANFPSPVMFYSNHTGFPHVDNVGGNVLHVTKTDKGDCNGGANEYGYFYDFEFHTAPRYCDRIPVTLTEQCPCSRPTDITFARATPETLCEGDNFASVGVTVTTPGAAQNTAFFLSISKDGGAYSSPLNIGAAQNPSGVVPAIAGVTTGDAGTYTVRIEDGNAGSASCYYEEDFVLNVSALPAAPTGSSPSDFCENGTSPSWSATAGAGNELLWYTAATGGTGSTTMPTIANTPAGTQNIWVSQRVAALPTCEGPRTALTVDVIANPTAPTASGPADFCENSTSPSWNASAGAGNELLWYTAATGGTGSTTMPIIPNTPAGTKSIWVSQRLTTAPGCEGPRTALSVDVIAAPTTPTASAPADFCESSTAPSWSATAGAGNELLWYTAATGGTGSTTMPAIPNTPAGTQNIWVSQRQTAAPSCESGRVALTVDIIANPTAPTASAPADFCEGTTAPSWSATAAGGNELLWYTAATGGTGSTTMPAIPNTPAGTQNIWVSQRIATAPGCEGPRTALSVDVIANPADPTASAPADFCENSTAPSWSATAGAGNELLWHTAATGGTGSTTMPAIPNTPAGTQNIWVSQRLTAAPNCESGRVALTVDVIAAPSAPAATAQTDFCENTTSPGWNATATAGSELLWYTAATGGTGSITEPAIAITPSGTRDVWVSQRLTTAPGCESTRTPLSLTVFDLPEVSITGNQTICDDGSYDIPITIDVATTPNYTVTYTGPSGAGSAGPAAGSLTIPVTPAAAGTYTLSGVTDGNGCSGTATGSVTVDVHPAINVSDLGFTCDKFAGTYTVDLDIQDGVAGYTVNGEADSNTPFATAGTFTSQDITIDGSGAGSYSFTVTDASGCTSGTQVINGTYDCNCSITGNISAATAEFCEGGDTDILVNISGGVVGDYTVDYTFTPTATGTPAPATANFTGDQVGAVLTNITESGTVTLNAITDSDCGTNFTQTVTITVNPLPEAELTGGTTICDDASATLTVNLTNPTSGPYAIPYTGNPGGTLNGSLAITVLPAEAGTYTLTGITDDNGCVGTITGTAQVVDVHPAINVSDLGFTCDKFAGTYTVDLDIQDGVAGYTVNGEADSNTPFATAGTFTSQDIAIDGSGAGSYSFTVTDASGCASGTQVINGTYDCNCSITGSIAAASTEFCEGGDTDITIDISGGVVGDYAVDYTFTPTATGTPAPATVNFTGDQTGAVLTNVTESGTVTLNAITDSDCGTNFTQTVTITVNPLPEAELTGGTTICDDGTATLTANITNATTAPYTLNYTGNPGGTLSGGTLTIPVTPTTAGTYALTDITDDNGCVGTITGTSQIVDVHPAINVADLGFTCDKFAGTYTVDLDIQDGVAGYTVDGEADSNTPFATAGTFTSTPITISGTGTGSYSFTVTDASGCASGTQMINGTYDCNCSITGSIAAASTEFCEGGDTDITIDISGGVVGDYTVDYTFTPTATGTPAPASANFAGDQAGAVLTNVTESGTVTLNAITDSDCGTSFTQTVTITVNPLPEAELTGGTTICDDGSATLTANITNATTAPYTLNYTGNPGGTLSGGTLTIPVAPTAAGTYTLTDITDDNGCAGTIIGTAQIVDVYPALTTSNQTVACDKFAGTFTVSFDIAGGTAPYTINGEQDVNATLGADGTFTSAAITIPASEMGNYNFTVTDASGCTVNTGVAVTGPYDCSCSITGGIAAVDDEFCVGGNTDITVDIAGGAIGDYTVSYTFTPTSTGTPAPATANFTGDQTGVVLTNITEAGTVRLTNIADSDCGSGFGQDVLINTLALPTATVSGGGAVCDDNTATATVSIALTGAADYTLTYTDGTTPTTVTATASPYTFDVTSAGAATYTVTALTDNNGCVATAAELTGNAVVSTIALPEVTIAGGATICDDGVDQATITINGTVGTGEWSGTFTTPSTTENFTTTAGTFSYPTMEVGTYSLQTVTDLTTGCSNTVTGSTVVDATALPAIASITSNATTCPALTASETFTATLDAGAGPATSYNWTVTSGTITSGQGTAMITVDFTGQTGPQTIEVIPVGCNAGAARTTTITVEQINDPSVSIDPINTLCFDANTKTFTADIDNAVTPTVSWTLDGTFIGNGTNTASGNTISTFDYYQGATLRVDVTTGNTCTTTPDVFAEVVLSVKDPATKQVPTISSTNFCQAEGAKPMSEGIFIADPTLQYNKIWYVDRGFGPEVAGINTSTIQVSQSGTYWLEVSHNICPTPTRSDLVTVVVDQMPLVDAGPEVVVEEGEYGTLEGTVIGPTDPGTGIYWSEPLPQMNQYAAYTTFYGVGERFESPMTLTAINGTCRAEAVTFITIRPDVYIPKVFTPNGDGENDEWFIKNMQGYKEARVRVFNRWGNEVWRNDKSYYDEPWDGTRNGAPMPIATYYYIIEFGYGKEPKQGSVTIIR